MIRAFSFSENAKRLSSLLQDNPMTQADSVVYWTEYLIRHGAETNIRPPSANASWTCDFMIDLYITLTVTIFVLWFCTRAVFRRIISKFKALVF